MRRNLARRERKMARMRVDYTGCPTRYRIRHFVNNSNTNEDIVTKFEQGYVRCVRNEEECVCSVSVVCLLLRLGAAVWCGMSRWRIIGPIFFNATITAAAEMLDSLV